MTKTAHDTTFHPNDLTNADDNHQPPAPGESAKRRRPGRELLIGGGIAAAAAIGWLTLSGTGNDPSIEAEAQAGPVNTAEVIETDLVQEVSLDGTLGTVAGDPILASTDGVVTAVAPAGTSVAEAEVLYRIDNEPVVLLYGDTPAYRDIALGSQTISVTAAGAGVVTGVSPAGSIIEQGDVVYFVDGQPVVALYGTTPMYRTLGGTSTVVTGADVAQLESALAAMGFTHGGTVTVDDEFTFNTQLAVQDWQESLEVEIDGVVEPTDVVFIPGPSQIVEHAVTVGEPLVPGAEVATLATGFPSSGDDVAQLEESLAGQGFDADGEMDTDGIFTAETRQAIIDWQAAVGQTPDGVVNLGDIVFRPGSVRIAEQLSAPGASVNVGAEIAAISSDEQVVRVDIPAADQGLIEIGDPVTVVLPAFEKAPATLTSISTTATVSQDGETFFEGIVELDDPTAAAGLDEAPVTVNVVGDSAAGVTAVPVTALIALAEGGYAVEVQTPTGNQLVAVEPGFFADGLVAISSDSLSVGDTVNLP